MTVLEIRATRASPNDFPIWDMVLNTPPARPCISAGKTDAMTMFETVKSESAPMELRNMLVKGHAQYVQTGLTSAMRSGERQDRTVVMLTMESARMRWRTSPVAMLLSVPEMGVGRKRHPVSEAVRSWTSWKKKFVICSKALKAPQTINTLKQMVENAEFFQSEFAIRAGRPRRSWRPTQRTNPTISAAEIERNIMFDGLRMSDAFSVMILSPNVSIRKKIVP